MIYLCFPNNPSGVGITKEALKKWVDYALENQSILLYDAAYEAFITDPDMPHSIFEIEGAKKCAIEFRSFSKTAGFTGTRCAFSVIPKELEYDGVSLNKLWDRRQSTKMNGVSYVVQRGAEAVYSEEGKKEVRENIAYYLNNAKIIREGLKKAGFTVYGGEHSPMYGSRRRRGFPPGNSLTCCWRSAAWSVRRAPDLVQMGKASSA